MTVDRSLFHFGYQELPRWLCPTCGRGHIVQTAGSLINEETTKSASARDHPAWEPEWTDRRFAGLLRCDFANCGELVAIMGNVIVEEVYDFDEYGNPDRDYVEIYNPRGFTPAPLPIRLPQGVPDKVEDALKEAAGLLWKSPEAAANQVRQAVEHLLDAKGVRKTAQARKRLTLHARIEAFGLKDTDNAEIMLAIKWLGNSGSHAGGLTRADVLDAFDMIELVLTNLYDQSAVIIMKRVKAVNKVKGPVK